jgi:hypothetical protein
MALGKQTLPLFLLKNFIFIFNLDIQYPVQQYTVVLTRV